MNLEFELPADVQEILNKLNDAGYQAFLAGGCIRDQLMGRKPHDFDITTDARPEEVMQVFEKTYPTGIAHGTVLVRQGDTLAEVTTFRKDGKYEDHRRPDSVEFVDSIEEDLKRRDFTINAMAWSPKTGLVDLFEGQKDLKEGKIRAVGDPETRFEEDALRMLRAYRFAGKLGFEIEPATEKALEEKAHLLKEIAPERIAEELSLILENSPEVLDRMGGLLSDVLPEIQEMLECEQNNIHHYTDVLHHTIDALKYLQDHGFSRKRAWALLLHDTGKPASKTTNETGDHFKKHPQISSRLARRILKDFRFPAEYQKEIPQLVLLHDAFYKPTRKNLYKLMVEYGMRDDQIQDLFAIQKADIFAHTKHDRLPGLEEFITYYEKNRDRLPKTPADLPVSGHDVQDILHVEGKKVGDVLKALHREAFFNDEMNNREALLARLNQIAQDPDRFFRNLPDRR